MKSSCRLFFAILFFIVALGLPPFATAETAAPAAATLTSGQASSSLNTQIQYCVDQNNQYTIDSIQRCSFESRENLPLFKLAHSDFWIKIAVQSSESRLNRLLINIRPHFLYQLDLYEPDGNSWHRQQAGNRFTSRQAQSTLGGYSFLTGELLNNQADLFIHIRTSGLIYAAINVEPFELYPINKSKQQFEIGLQLGAQAFVLIFLIITHLFNPGLKLGRFTLLMMIVLLCTLSGSGLLSESLFADHPALDGFTFLGLFFLRVIGWVWVAQGILNTFRAPVWYNRTCSLFYVTMFASLVLNRVGMNAIGGALMVGAFFVTHIVQVIAAARMPHIPKIFKITLLIAFVLSDLILALTLLLTQHPIQSASSAIYFSRIGDFVQPLILLIVILFGGRLVLSDLNNTKSRLRELAHQTEIEHALLNERKLLVDMLTHEVRTPLGSIRLAIDSIKKYFVSNNTSDLKRFNNINQSLKNINDIIEHCSLMNQIDQHSLEINRTRVDLNELLKQYIAALDDASINRLHFKLQERVITDSDSYILKIIFTNLIENALKYSPTESTIYVNLQSGDLQGKNISITISNRLTQGKAPDLTQIFDRYYRSPLVKHITGTGLGLHLSRVLTVRLGGHLSASVHDDMITFTVSLPQVDSL